MFGLSECAAAGRGVRHGSVPAAGPGLPTHTQVRAGRGHPESATVPVGCQAARPVKYRRCRPGPAPLGPCSQTRGAALVSGSSSYARADTGSFLTVRFPSLSLSLSPKIQRTKCSRVLIKAGEIAAVSRWASLLLFCSIAAKPQ